VNLEKGSQPSKKRRLEVGLAAPRSVKSKSCADACQTFVAADALIQWRAPCRLAVLSRFRGAQSHESRKEGEVAGPSPMRPLLLARPASSQDADTSNSQKQTPSPSDHLVNYLCSGPCSPDIRDKSGITAFRKSLRCLHQHKHALGFSRRP
jgi:hypothetical protein